MFCRTVLQMTAVMELVLLHDVTSAGGAHWERLFISSMLRLYDVFQPEVEFRQQQSRRHIGRL